METIIIEVRGGVVEVTSKIPAGIRIEVRDYDMDDEHETLNGVPCAVGTWEAM